MRRDIMLPRGNDYWYPVELRSDCITVYRAKPPCDLTPLYMTCECAKQIWPSPGSPLELCRVRLDLPGVEDQLWEHLRSTLSPEISEKLRRLVYGTFLESRYWLLTKALLLKARQNRCENCRRHGPLDVHHLTYEHRGSEVFHLDDLALLCHPCHFGRHGDAASV